MSTENNRCQKSKVGTIETVNEKNLPAKKEPTKMQTNRIEVYTSEKRIKEFANLDDAIIWANPRPWSHRLFFENWNRNELVQSGILKQIITTNMEVT